MHRKLKMSGENAVDSVVRELRRMIFDGELQAKQPLRQEDLAARLGTSRHPVREALGRLTGEGLVTFRPRHGYTVTVLSPEEITEIFEMRMVLEEHAGYVATLKRTQADVERLEEMLLAMEPLHRRTPANMAPWSTYNREFHARLFLASGRRHLCRHGIHREAEGALLGPLQRPNAHDLPGDLFAAIVADRDDDEVLPRLLDRRVAYDTLDAQSRLGGHLALRRFGVEAQVMQAAWADAQAFENRRLAVRTNARLARNHRARGDVHALPKPLVSPLDRVSPS